MKTLRLIFPEWQGGANPHYAFGARLLAQIAPPGAGQETLEVPVDGDFSRALELEGGVYAAGRIAARQRSVRAILKEKRPDRLVVFGGDCSVSQAPFDYLHGRYPDGLGLLWLDAHPDISTPRDFTNAHAMVLGNLLGDGAPQLAALVEHPFRARDVLYVGLRAEEMLPHESDYLKRRDLAFLRPEDMADGSAPALKLLRERGLRRLAVHLDLDVLSTEDFRSLLCNEPGLGGVSYAKGSMRLDQITELLRALQGEFEIVGLSLAEYMPWDLIRLSEALGALELFR